jgi:hypothetical protein
MLALAYDYVDFDDEDDNDENMSSLDTTLITSGGTRPPPPAAAAAANNSNSSTIYPAPSAPQTRKAAGGGGGGAGGRYVIYDDQVGIWSLDIVMCVLRHSNEIMELYSDVMDDFFLSHSLCSLFIYFQTPLSQMRNFCHFSTRRLR